MKKKPQPKSSKTSKIVFISIMSVSMLAILAGFACAIITSLSGIFASHTKPKYIAPYLYEISYNDYAEDVEGVTHQFSEAFGCSSVRNGNFYGRNFDFIFNDAPEFVVRMSAKDGRHASIGVATHYGLREVQLQQGKYDKQLDLIPNLTLDGINDAGVIASINVAPGAEDVGELTGTNPSGKDLNSAFTVRYILDNASSADEAIELLKSRNIYGSAVDGLYIHIMIADKDKTYVVEFINNEMVAQEKTGTDQIMTNFYVNLPEYTEHAVGIERYNILKENYAQGSTFSGMRELMMRVKYSNAYAYSTEPWYSEVLTQSDMAYINTPEFAQYYDIYENVQKDYWNFVTNDIRNPANKSFWHTTHNSVYDIERHALRLTVQEEYSYYYDFAL